MARTQSFVFGSLNVHRADCDRTHRPICQQWPDRRMDLFNFLRRYGRASVYALQECKPEQAVWLTTALGWGTEKNPAYVIDENFNVIIYDRSKWTDDGAQAFSLSNKPGDKGDVHRRSLVLVNLVSLKTGLAFLAGASHLETGDPQARVLNAAAIGEVLNRSEFRKVPIMIGIDRNSYTSDPAGPRAVFRAAGFQDVVDTVPGFNPDKENSFNGFDTPKFNDDCIDGIHYRNIKIRDGGLRSTAPGGRPNGGKPTDHSLLVANATLQG